MVWDSPQCANRRLWRRAAATLSGLVLLMSVTARPVAATCVGDCNLDQQVTVDELITMINVALGTAGVGSCVAGDGNHDGDITVDEIISAVAHALSGCPLEPTPSATAPPTDTPGATPPPTATPENTATATATPGVNLGSASGHAGDTVGVPITLSDSGGVVVAASLDIRFDPTQVTVALKANGKPNCTINPDIDVDSALGKELVSTVLTAPPLQILRIGIVGLGNATPIPDGLLATCDFVIAPTAAPGLITLGNTPGLSDAIGDSVAVGGTNGSITVQ